VSDVSASGVIVKAQSGFFTVDAEGERIVCQLRGKLKRGKSTGDIAALGDRVRITIFSDASGAIEAVEQRRRAIVRLDPRPHGAYQQVLLANPDQAVFVFACAQPDPKLRMLDRFLVIAEKQRVPPLLVANKIDLVGKRQAKKTFGLYATLGYPLILTSAKSGEGVAEFKAHLRGKISAMAGPSGVGKSSLLNRIQPGLNLAISEVGVVNKGKHTTVTREMFPLESGGYVADAPGWKSLALWDTKPEEMDAYFPELAELVAKCQFSDCTHVHEPGCAVRAGLADGRVSAERYESYLRLRGGRDG